MMRAWGWHRLLIFGRTFLLMLAALLISEAIGLALVVSQPNAADTPVRVASIARALRQPDDRRQEQWQAQG